MVYFFRIESEGNEDILNDFKERIFYFRGQYDSGEDFGKLDKELREKDSDWNNNGWVLI